MQFHLSVRVCGEYPPVPPAMASSHGGLLNALATFLIIGWADASITMVGPGYLGEAGNTMGRVALGLSSGANDCSYIRWQAKCKVKQECFMQPMQPMVILEMACDRLQGFPVAASCTPHACFLDLHSFFWG